MGIGDRSSGPTGYDGTENHRRWIDALAFWSSYKARPGSDTLCPGIARREVEGNLAQVVHNEVGREWAAGFGDEAFEQAGAVLRQQLFRLSAIDRLLQDDLVDLEFAG